MSQNNAQAMASTYNTLHGLSPEDTVLFHSSISFDMSVAQIWGTLTSGAKMALALKDVKRDPFKLATFMGEASVTFLNMVPTQLACMLEPSSTALSACSSLRRIILGGEALQPPLVRAIYDLGIPATIWNQWGPSECTVSTIFGEVDYPGEDQSSLPLGYAVNNASHYVVDERMLPVPVGVLGQICVCGAQVSGGYVNRPDETAQNFVEDPFASEGFRSQGWTTMYKTGDQGCFRPNGLTEFHGRISGDKQIKLRGYRIDLGEVEDALYRAAAALDGSRVAEATVLARGPEAIKCRAGDERQLIAFLALSESIPMNDQRKVVNALHTDIRRSLNNYMLPNGYHIYAGSLPKLISGKLDRQMLLQQRLDLIFAGPVQRDDERHPELEANEEHQDVLPKVNEAFKEVLKLPEVYELRTNESFFDLGGHSASLVRLNSTLKNRFKVDTTLVELIEKPTPAGVTQTVVEKLHRDQNGAASKVSHGIEIDWELETALSKDPRWSPGSGKSTATRSETTNVLLVGAESFVGVHILRELLAATPSLTVHVLASEGQTRLPDLARLFDRWHLFKEPVTRAALAPHTRIVPGTLAQPSFGLTEEQFEVLGRSLYAIYYAGGHVSLLKPYTELRRSNVESVRDLIELAKVGSKLTELHYLSTWSVAHLQSWTDTQRTLDTIDVTEQSFNHFRPDSGNQLGYFKSRWAAERLLERASHCGFPVTIYRSSAVSAPAASGLAPSDDNFTHNMILDMIATGKIPSFDAAGPGIDFDLDFVPIDYLATVLAGLSLSDHVRSARPVGTPHYFHIGNPSPLPLARLPDLLPTIKGGGAAGERLPVEAWLAGMPEIDAAEETRQLERTVLRAYFGHGHRMFALDRSRLEEALVVLRESGGAVVEAPPPVDAEFLGVMFRRSRQG